MKNSWCPFEFVVPSCPLPVHAPRYRAASKLRGMKSATHKVPYPCCLGQTGPKMQQDSQVNMEKAFLHRDGIEAYDWLPTTPICLQHYIIDIYSRYPKSGSWGATNLAPMFQVCFARPGPHEQRWGDDRMRGCLVWGWLGCLVCQLVYWHWTLFLGMGILGNLVATASHSIVIDCPWLTR